MSHSTSAVQKLEGNSFCHLHNKNPWQELIAAMLIPLDLLGCANACSRRVHFYCVN